MTFIPTGTPYAQASVQPVAISVSAAATANAAVLPAPTNGKTMYITGFDVTGGGATTALGGVAVAVTGLLASIGTLTFFCNVLAGNTGPVNAQGGLSVTFPDPLPASAPNAAITVTCPSFGAGNLMAAVTAYGFVA